MSSPTRGASFEEARRALHLSTNTMRAVRGFHSRAERPRGLASILERRQRRLAMCLALIAGYVDAYGLSAFGTYVSFMSGNTTQVGSMTGRGRLVEAVPPALAILFFVCGSCAGTYLTHSRLRHSRRLLFGVVAALLAATAAVSRFGPAEVTAGIATISFSMGIMNTTLPRIGAESVSLTFMTGDLNRIGSHVALAFKGVPLPDTQGPWDTQLHRAGLLASLWGSFLIGALISAAMISHLGVWVLVLPCLILVALALFSASPPSQSVGEQHLSAAECAERPTTLLRHTSDQVVQTRK